ncbi:MAG: hypothetical protein IT479_07355 [Xanthomonadales bacterium]|nr:hypothetical protein [Xanthomonadales bacterium]MCC6593080.1 hypothetical protein [Xanthomonadales bacterium]MCE7930384.1 hypothetical protein [Xanthomonadales bacterium PRO6]
MHKRPIPIAHRRQRGAALFLAMIFLVLLAVLALAASSTSIMQERMTGGLRNDQLGLMGAESAVRGGEARLWNLSFNSGQPFPPCVGGSTGACVYMADANGLFDARAQAFRTQRTWINPASDGAFAYDQTLTSLTGSAITASIASQPRILIQYLGPARTPPFRSGGAIHPAGTTARVGEHHLYRVTARSQGGTNAVVRVVESYFSSMNLTNTNYNPGDP